MLPDTFHYHLIRTYDGGDPEDPLPAIGCSTDFDDFQVIFDPHNRQLRINLTGYQIRVLERWGWELPDEGRVG